jgi:hypothetical protein
MKRLYIIIGIIILTGCASYSAINFDKLYGKAKPHDRVVASVPSDHVDYWSDVKPVLNNRCVVCHGCYDAPCQLKTTAIEGLDRGASKRKVYHASRLKHASLTRLFEDANSVDEWREKDFFPVLNEHKNIAEANKEAGLMYQLLALKEKNPLPVTTDNLLPKELTMGYDRKEICATPNEMHRYTEKNPLWGMPYALPGLNPVEQSTLKTWLEQGARYTPRQKISAVYQLEIDKWEALLNGESTKEKLISRYIYEHLYIGHLYFDGLDVDGLVPTFFKLVRSATPPGEPLEQIATRRPYDAPGVELVYYRIVPELETVVVKTHLPYRLDAIRMQRWQALFFNDSYEVSKLPGYDKTISANPFITFQQLPMESRYKFMLDEAQFTIMNFIKGPVCRGQVAINVIKDHFWVFFIDPNLSINDDYSDFIDVDAKQLALPSAEGDIYMPLTNWNKYAGKVKQSIRNREHFLLDHFKSKEDVGGTKIDLDLDLIWNGEMDDGTSNTNAALTIFRHSDNASVYKGMVGQPPQTAWIIGYPLLEKIHYLLVAGYDVYGNAGHQLLSRLYMDFLRMDGESNFLTFLPKEAMIKERENWYRKANPKVMQYLSSPLFESQISTAIDYTTPNPKQELYAMLAKHLGPALSKTHSLNTINNRKKVSELTRLASFKGKNTALLSEMTVIKIMGKNNKNHFVSVTKNNAHINITSLFSENKNLIPEENTVTVAYGLIGSYPNTFMRVAENDLSEFVDQLLSISTPSDYAILLDDYGVRRTTLDFWQYSDELHQFFYKLNPVEYGYLDYNRLENR